MSATQTRARSDTTKPAPRAMNICASTAHAANAAGTENTDQPRLAGAASERPRTTAVTPPNSHAAAAAGPAAPAAAPAGSAAPAAAGPGAGAAGPCPCSESHARNAVDRAIVCSDWLITRAWAATPVCTRVN
ncbi:hypothetical protein G6F31_017536 [Rhizopus arrhizus]|nr:hypothetical protein G6F31_017536 [Rhizopus arrhizus]